MSKTYTYTLNKEYSLQYTGFTVSSLISRGFTGHSLSRDIQIGKHLDNVQLINMFSEDLVFVSDNETKALAKQIPMAIRMSQSGNGRLYDPIIARFLSPDNNVQMPDYTQNLNRYSYCINNPLKYTDPNGEWFGIDDLIEFVAGGIVNVIFNANKIDNGWELLGYFVSGGTGTWMAIQSFGLAAPAGAAITTFMNSTLDTDFLTKENGYSFSSISKDQWKDIGFKTGIGTMSGFIGSWAGDKISDKLISSTNITSKFWTDATEKMIGGGIVGGLNDYGKSIVVDNNKPFSKQAFKDLGKGAGMGVLTGFTYTFVKQKWVDPHIRELQKSLQVQPTDLKNYNYIYDNKYVPNIKNPNPNIINPGNMYNPTFTYPIIPFK